MEVREVWVAGQRVRQLHIVGRQVVRARVKLGRQLSSGRCGRRKRRRRALLRRPVVQAMAGLLAVVAMVLVVVVGAAVMVSVVLVVAVVMVVLVLVQHCCARAARRRWRRSRRRRADRYLALLALPGARLAESLRERVVVNLKLCHSLVLVGGHRNEFGLLEHVSPEDAPGHALGVGTIGAHQMESRLVLVH